MSTDTSAEQEYQSLRERYSRMVTGAPDTPELRQILEILFTPEEAALAQRLPGRPVALESIAKRLNRPATEVGDRLTAMADKGLILDFERGGTRYFLLPPIVIGLFEFVFMRAHDGLPMAELAALFERYMNEEGGIARTAFQKQTQLSRSLVHEEALPEGDFTEVLDWERSSVIVETAKAVGVSRCACRYKAGLLGHACGAPVHVCLTFNESVEALAKHGMSKPISNAEGLKILEECKAAGLAQTGDNVQRKVGYICHCCRRCCGEMQAVKRFDLPHAIVSSNWLARIDAEKCKGCGKCVKACPVEIIELREQPDNGHTRKVAQSDEERCLGCGVCYGACKHGAIALRPREKRVFTPKDTYERVFRMAIERGKLADLIFDAPETLSHRVLLKVLRAIENSPPAKAALAIEPLRSAFLNQMLKKVK